MLFHVSMCNCVSLWWSSPKKREPNKIETVNENLSEYRTTERGGERKSLFFYYIKFFHSFHIMDAKNNYFTYEAAHYKIYSFQSRSLTHII